ncbi:hypothetical protein Lepto7375DRAFT_3885 [Leptolyngbya sp. PCC 7375]|nr:hypothetical protein Lepto7375DRAFT_3885 [Leptolyngbya sp. PCC 7375]
MMIRCSAFLALAIAAGTVAVLAPKASAEDFEVPFEGTITNICEFTVDSPGSLERDSSSGYMLVGDSAQVTANCSSPANVMVTSVNQVEGTTPFPFAIADLIPTNGGPSQSISVAAGGESFGIEMHADSGNTPIENGNYLFNVLLTATPN